MQIKNASRIPYLMSAKTFKMWWRYSNSRDKLKLTANANNDGQNKYGSGSSAVKNTKMNVSHKNYVHDKAKQKIHLLLIVFRIVDHPTNGQQSR